MPETLREYLVALGWKIDEASWRKYQNILSLTASETAKAGSVAIETAIAIELMVAKVARRYEDLYYVSRRTAQSATFLQATQFGFKQIGLSADETLNAVESVSRALRLNPGLSALFRGARTPQEIVDQLKTLPYFVGAQLASLVGISEKTFQHLRMFGDEEKRASEDSARRRRDAGIDADKASERFTGFSRVLNKLEEDFDNMGTRIALDWIGPVEKGVGLLDEAVQWINRADKATLGWIGTLTTLGATLIGGFLGEKVLRGVLGKIGLNVGSKTFTGGLLGIAGRGAGALAGTAGAYALGIPGILLQSTAPLNQDEAGRRWNQPLAGPSRDAQAVDYFMAQGWTREQAIGIVANLKRESSLDPRSANKQGLNFFGLAQWDATRQAAFQKWAGHSLRDSTFEEQLAFVQWELTHSEAFAGGLLRRTGTASDAARTVSRAYERTDHPEREEPLRANIAEELSSSLAQQSTANTNNVNVNQKTDIHVSGAGANDTAQAVLRGQDRTNENLTRNVISAVR